MQTRWLTACLAVVAVLAAAPAALADTNTSSNWAGYAVHRPGLRFSRVIGSWREPSATCTPGTRSFSSFWVGLGGYSATAPALEQIGTEVDCAASGRVRSSAWYELVPAATRTIHLHVRPGDDVVAEVTASGRQVTLTLADTTTGRTFARTVRARLIDLSSAEWIAEAPSNCISATACQTLPLADFGSASFTGARAWTTRGASGTISNRHWRHSRILLLPSGHRFMSSQGSGVTVGAALPSALSAGGTTFGVLFSPLSAQSNALLRTRSGSVRAGGMRVS